MNTQRPSASQAKDQAKRLRRKKAEDGATVGYGKVLEKVDHQHGFRDWETIIARLGNRPPKDWVVGGKVSGTYLSRPFTARVVAVAMLKPGWFRLELHLDKAVDVVASDGFSNFRTRIRGIVGPQGHSIERTSDGQAHLQIDLW